MMEDTMRAILTAATATALLITPAIAQQQQYDHIDGFGHGVPAKPEYHQPARNEGAYQNALQRIPDAKEKADPWGTVREKPAAAK
jgi:hypothetical protein